MRRLLSWGAIAAALVLVGLLGARLLGVGASHGAAAPEHPAELPGAARAETALDGGAGADVRAPVDVPPVAAEDAIGPRDDGAPEVEEELGTLSGRVTLPDGSPADGAFVLATPSNTEPGALASDAEGLDMCDAEGRFAIENLPPDGYELSAYPWHPDYEGAQELAVVAPGSYRPNLGGIEFVLTVTVLEVTVAKPGGLAEEGAYVSCSTASEDAEGELVGEEPRVWITSGSPPVARILAAPGSSVFLRSQRIQSLAEESVLARELNSLPTILFAERLVAVGAAAGVQRVELELHPRGRGALEVELLGVDGVPVPRFHVVLFDALTGFSELERIGTAGRSRFEYVPAGRYSVQAVPLDGEVLAMHLPAAAEYPVEVVAGERELVRLVAPLGGRLLIRLELEDEPPEMAAARAAGDLAAWRARVVLAVPDGPELGEPVDVVPPIENELGVALPPGEYELRVYPGPFQAAAARATVFAGESAEVRIALRARAAGGR